MIINGMFFYHHYSNTKNAIDNYRFWI